MSFRGGVAAWSGISLKTVLQAIGAWSGYRLRIFLKSVFVPGSEAGMGIFEMIRFACAVLRSQVAVADWLRCRAWRAHIG